jgi:hypothetical protein
MYISTNFESHVAMIPLADIELKLASHKVNNAVLLQVYVTHPLWTECVVLGECGIAQVSLAF